MRAAVCLTRIKIWQHGKRIEKENKKSKMTLRERERGIKDKLMVIVLSD